MLGIGNTFKRFGTLFVLSSGRELLQRPPARPLRHDGREARVNRKIRNILAVLAVSAAAAGAYVGLGWARFGGAINAIGVDLRAPEGYVDTASLARLPRDLVRAPVLRDLLTEDFAFYYEDHEDRLGLRGALKRIAFEHEQTLADDLVEAALDQPSEVALWTDAKGAPRHWLLAMTRDVLARALQGLATVAAKDRQLTVIDEIRAGGASLTVYALSLSPRRTLALASRGNRVVVLSDPGLLFDAQRKVDAKAAAVVGELLSGDRDEQALYRRHFGIGQAGRGHTLVAGGRLLSFGYQHFFPGLQALRLDLGPDGSALRTRVRLPSAQALPNGAASRPLWSALPIHPAACALLPVDWTRVRAVLDGKGAAAKQLPAGAAALAGQLDGPAAICWYARSQMHTPLLLAQTRSEAVDAGAVADFMRWWLPKRAEFGEAPPAGAAVQRWQASVAAPYGPHGEADAPQYRPTLARQGRWWAYSPDETLVELALATQARRYPSVADALPAAGGTTLGVATPAELAGLLRREAFEVLAPEHESFRQAAEELLLPRLATLGRLAPLQAVTEGRPDAQGWMALQWQPLKPR